MAHVPIERTWEELMERRTRRWWPRLIADRLSLRATMIVYVILPLAIILTIGGAIGLRELEHRMELRLQEDVQLVGRAIQPALSRAVNEGRIDTVNRALEAAFSIDRVFGAYVYDSSGATIATAGQQGSLPSRRQVSQLAQQGNRTGEYGEVAGQEVYSYFVPLTDSGARIIGLLQVTRRGSDFDEYIGMIRTRGAAFVLLVLGMVTSLVLYGHYGAVGRHVDRIVKSMGEVEAGHHEARSPVGGPKEIAQLGKSLNAMLDSIQQAEEEVEKHRAAELELFRRLQGSEKLAAIGQLAAGVAHELGTPLSVIYGKGQQLLRNDLSDASRQGLVQITKEVRRMEKIVRQLLDFGRGRTLERRSVKVGKTVAHSCDALQGLAQTHGVTLTNETESEDLEMLFDRLALEQAVGNLVRNAIQAAPGGEVRVETHADANNLHISVDDNGSGIPEEIRDRIFEPFFTTKPVGQGSGLGLALTHGAVRDIGGTIEFGPSKLGGVRFEIILPLITTEREEQR